jgi:hypothetical protein
MVDSKMLKKMTYKALNLKREVLLKQIREETEREEDVSMWESMLNDLDKVIKIKQDESKRKREESKIEKEEKKKLDALEAAIEAEKRRILMEEEEERKMVIIRIEAAKRAEEERKRLIEEEEKRRIEAEKRAIEEEENKRKKEEFEKAVLARMEEIILNDIEMKEKIHKEAMTRLADRTVRQSIMDDLFASGKIVA